MSSQKSVLKTSYAFRMMAALAVSGSLFTCFAAHADDSLTSAIELNPSFRVHSAPEASAPSNGTISKSEIISAEQMKDHGSDHSTWVKVIRQDGSAGYVRGGTLHKVVLGDNYIVHENPSLSGKRIGTVSQVSKDAPLVLTGRSKIVSEKNKKINWLEVLHNGKAAWVASDSVKSVDAEKSAVSKVSQPDGKKWVAPQDVPVPVSRPVKTAAKLDNSKLVPVQVPDVLIPPPKKDEKSAKSAAAPSVKVPPTKAVSDLVCVKTREEFKASPQMQKAFGDKYDPFVQWTGDAGPVIGKLSFTPANDAEGTWLLQSVEGPPNNPAEHVPAQICLDHGGKHLFVSALGQQVNLSNKNQITVTAQGTTVTFNRTVK